MADLSITAASVVADPSAIQESGQAGEALTAGKIAYLDPTSRKLMLADSNSATAAARKARGMVLNSGALNQPVRICTGGEVTVGSVLTKGTIYALSETPGGLQPVADLASGEDVCIIGVALSTSVLDISINAPGVTI
jgi:hypothetical protein